MTLVAVTGPITRARSVPAHPSTVKKTWTTSTGFIDVTLPCAPDTYTRPMLLNSLGEVVGIGNPSGPPLSLTRHAAEPVN